MSPTSVDVRLLIMASNNVFVVDHDARENVYLIVQAGAINEPSVTACHKDATVPVISQMLTLFTCRPSSKFLIKDPPRVKRVATLPCQEYVAFWFTVANGPVVLRQWYMFRVISESITVYVSSLVLNLASFSFFLECLAFQAAVT